ncbi:MAG: L,D-transpeptidase [Verrucomicrobia bacterium]|nr:L,D-transpeptidase [Verrucomicrobiota bacterium]MBV8275954.1 L,D-transpeptidase [Verrucomicrobiota bacterium]
MQHSRFLGAPVIVSLYFFLCTAPSYGQAHTKGREVSPLTPTLKPGEYIWHPEVSPSGPVVVLVSIPDQLVYVYRNGVRIGRSTVSTGKPGKQTPTGVFTVLQKKVRHESSIYKGAKMPHMQRLTWSGIAMHAGHLPGYPASAGCVRMPVDFAAKLYSVTSLGTTVIIADNRSATRETTNPGLLFSGKTGSAASKFQWNPEKAAKGPVSIIISNADRAAYVYRNGTEIGRTPVNPVARLSGSYVYTALDEVDANGQREWMATASSSGGAPDLKDVANRLGIPPEFDADLRQLITPGTTLVLTNLPVNAGTRSAPGFDILTD